MLAVVDCFDALTSDRPYRPRMTDADALKIITDRSGTMYDPRVVDAFFACTRGGADDVADRRGPGDAGHRSAADLDAGPQPDARAGGVLALGRALVGVTRRRRRRRASCTSTCSRTCPPSTLVAYGYDRGSDAIVALAKPGGEPGCRTGTTIPLGERVSGWVAATHHSALNSDARLDVDDDERARHAAAQHPGGAGARPANAARRALALSPPASRRSTRSIDVCCCRPRRCSLLHPSWRAECAEAAHVRIPVRTHLVTRGVRDASGEVRTTACLDPAHASRIVLHPSQTRFA